MTSDRTSYFACGLVTGALMAEGASVRRLVLIRAHDGPAEQAAEENDRAEIAIGEKVCEGQILTAASIGCFALALM